MGLYFMIAVSTFGMSPLPVSSESYLFSVHNNTTKMDSGELFLPELPCHDILSMAAGTFCCRQLPLASGTGSCHLRMTLTDGPTVTHDCQPYRHSLFAGLCIFMRIEEKSMKKFNPAYVLLKDMYEDDYYPAFLVDKVRDELISVIELLESGETDIERIQDSLDRAVEGINDLQDEFDAHDSEIETVARESIGESVTYILSWFGIGIDIEEAIRARDW